MLKKTLFFAVMALGLAACDSPTKVEAYQVPTPEVRADAPPIHRGEKPPVPAKKKIDL